MSVLVWLPSPRRLYYKTSAGPGAAAWSHAVLCSSSPSLPGTTSKLGDSEMNCGSITRSCNRNNITTLTLWELYILDV